MSYLFVYMHDYKKRIEIINKYSNFLTKSNGLPNIPVYNNDKLRLPIYCYFAYENIWTLCVVTFTQHQ